ncbi:hypothetical protein BJX66DRAFT_319926 [Aspergillus keveii]|uniref:Uncharacterized protein n=1 Tax=Aspergillus keveii TaxID=714993 RepID=A0ABR4FHR3_9EURO
MAVPGKIRTPELIKTHPMLPTAPLQTLIYPENYSTKDFTAKVENSSGPVFLFLPPNFEPLSPETRRFATAFPHLAVYGITHPDCAEVREDLTDRHLKRGGTEFMLWENGNMVVALLCSDIMPVLRAIVC